MFEFMKIDEKASAAATPGMPKDSMYSEPVKNLTATSENLGMLNDESNFYFQQNKDKISKDTSGRSGPVFVSQIDSIVDSITGFFKDLVNVAKRNYVGSVALYMPTDIQINDQLIYNEDTRKIGAIFESMLNKEKGDWDVWNPTVMTDPTVTTAIGAIAGKFAPFGLGSNTSAAVTAFATYGIGDILQTELQRATGQVVNPNELLRYASTALRTFTFNWTFLPDSEDESKQVTGLIKLFRRSAHAKRDSSTLIIVPDHCIVSFHGAADMVQVPPCYIESVNVNYNPNNSSFFIEGNRPVEIKMSVTLKEIVPIYQHNIDEGY